MIDMGSVNLVRESQQLWLLSGRLFERESAAALQVSGRLFERELTAAQEDEWTALQKRVNSGSEVVGSSKERLDRDRLFEREACLTAP